MKTKDIQSETLTKLFRFAKVTQDTAAFEGLHGDNDIQALLLRVCV